MPPWPHRVPGRVHPLDRYCYAELMSQGTVENQWDRPNTLLAASFEPAKSVKLLLTSAISAGAIRRCTAADSDAGLEVRDSVGHDRVIALDR
jgi:hypothetical protein